MSNVALRSTMPHRLADLAHHSFSVRFMSLTSCSDRGVRGLAKARQGGGETSLHATIGVICCKQLCLYDQGNVICPKQMRCETNALAPYRRHQLTAVDPCRQCAKQWRATSTLHPFHASSVLLLLDCKRYGKLRCNNKSAARKVLEHQTGRG